MGRVCAHELCFAMGLAAAVALVSPAGAEPRHGFSVFGTLQYEEDFEHFDYVNPSAPAGGTLRMSGGGTFDNLNPYIRQGRVATGATFQFDTLMAISWDEPSAQYGLVAETIDVAADMSAVTFTIREEARFHDGRPITPDDLVFSYEAIRDHGAPRYQVNYRSVDRAEISGPRSVTFHLTTRNAAEPILIIGQMPIFAKHYWQGRDFENTTLEPFVTSGPYRVGRIDPGRIIEFHRVEDYWARDLNVNVGRFNFDIVRYDYFRDFTVSLEALKAYVIDVRFEGVSKDWATNYDFPGHRAGLFRQEILRTERPRGQRGSFFNLRLPIFQDIRVREALASAFDFEWENRVLFYSAYDRTISFFQESELQSMGRPPERELAMLEPFREAIPPGVFGEPFVPPVTSGWGWNTDVLRRADQLLVDAGWVVENGERVNATTGQSLDFEILLSTPAYERVMMPYTHNLRRLGIEARIRVVDTSQYLNRRGAFDYGMVIQTNSHTLSPGTELRTYYGSAAAWENFSRNYAGIENPAVDYLIERIIDPASRDDLVAAARALDRVLMWSHYIIPGYHSPGLRLAFWDRFGRPAQRPRYATGFPDTWWVDVRRDAEIEEGIARIEG